VTNWSKHSELQKALRRYCEKREYVLSGLERYASGIDCVSIYINKTLMFIISLPPLSNYEIEETSSAHNYYTVPALV